MSLFTYKSQLLFNNIFNVKNYLRFRDDKLGFISEVSKLPGQIIRFNIGHEKLFLLKDPNDIKKVLIGDNDLVDKGTPGYDGLRRYLGNGLLSIKNQDWSLHRKIAAPFFMSQQVEKYFSIFRNVARDKVKKASLLHSTEASGDLNFWAADVTLTILGETILGLKFNKETTDIASSLNTIFDTTIKNMYHPVPALQKLPMSSRCPYNKAKSTLQNIVLSVIEKNRRNMKLAFDKSARQRVQERTHFVAQLMEGSYKDGNAMPFQQIFDEIITMIQAGHETSSNALIWTLVHLHTHPEKMKILIDELQKLTADYSLQELDQLEYLNACILESMRLDPPAWAFDRRVLKDFELSGQTFKKNSLIVISPYVIHRLNSYWENPESFLPERFLGKTLNLQQGYFPFGFGQRICIGQRFAMIELKTILAEILLNVDLKIQSPTGIKREGSITLRPQGAIPFQCRVLMPNTLN